MDSTGQDPWYWTVDEVVVALKSAQLHIEANSVNVRVDILTGLEDNIREQEIDGLTLLNDVNAQFIKEDLQIKSLGTRSALLRTITYLRTRSQRYAEQATTSGPGFTMSQPLQDREKPLSIYTPPTASHVAGRSASFDARTAIESAPLVGESEPIRARPGEAIVVDDQGRKRRKIALPKTKQGADVEGRMPAKPTVDTIFFGQTSLGQNLGPDEELAELSFVSDESSSTRGYVHRQILRFLRNREQEQVQKNGKSALALYPYPQRMAPKSKIRSAIILQQVGTEVEAVRGDPVRLEENVSEEAHLNQEWDFLNHWSNEESRELPLLGESETELDDSSSFLAELEAEEREEAEAKLRPKKGPLSSEEVSDILEQTCHEFKSQWAHKKLPLREHTAWSIWRKGRNVMDRKKLIAGSKTSTERYRQRLGSYKSEITGEIWHNKKELRRQCDILQETIWQIEEEEWRLAIWRKNVEPPRRPAKPRSQKKVTVQHHSDTDGVDLGSSSEEAIDSDNDFMDNNHLDFNDFMDIDQLDLTGPLPAVRSSGSENEAAVPEAFEIEQVEVTPTNLAPSAIEVQDPSQEKSVDDSVVGPLASDAMEISRPNSPARTPEPVPETQAGLRSSASVIDLTYSSDASPFDDDTEINTSHGAGNRAEDEDATIHDEAWKFGKKPEHASAEIIASWSWDELTDRSDNKRIIVKLVHEMSPEDKAMLTQRIRAVRKSLFIDEIKRAVGVLVRMETKMPGVQAAEFDKIIKFTKLYGCWNQCNADCWTEGISHEVSKEMLLDIQKNKVNLDYFHEFMMDILVRPRPPSPPPTVAVPVIEMSDSDLDGLQETPSKRRRKPIAKSKVAMEKRETARRRRANQEERELQLEHNIASNPSQDGHAKIVVNTSKRDDEPYIYLHTHIASKIKKHQVEGVRFMWREIVTAGQKPQDAHIKPSDTQPELVDLQTKHDDGQTNSDEGQAKPDGGQTMPHRQIEPEDAKSSSQGCLLAHTMGLGKTMQTIALLVTIAEAANSADEAIRNQIPKKLRLPRYLVICPASLVQNWTEEIRMWVPLSAWSMMGRMWHFGQDTPADRRLLDLEEWSKGQGVLVMSYDLLRNLVQNKSRLGSEQHGRVKKQLLHGPRIIVADEAHAMKNLDSGISTVTGQFKSKSRIALTGSPLANNLLEYYALVDWVSPGYLGSLTEFRDYYKNPIERGLYVDSEPFEFRHALKMLHALKVEIEPKVHRADIAVLAGDLTPKVEFTIMVPLTKLQEEAYSAYAQAIQSDSRDVGKAFGTSFLVWLDKLSLLCNHPAIFFTKIFESDKSKKSASDVRITGSEGEDAPDAAADEPIVPEAIKEPQRLIFERFKEGIENFSHSYKMEMVDKILDHASEVGDRTLVFSHSISTLDFLERSFLSKRRRYQRLDGSTRTSIRQDAVKGFNESRNGARVFLISTRAGGLGLNLPGANRVIIIDFKFNPQWEQQAIGRAYRIGQKKPVFVYRFLAGGTFEEQLYNQVVFKTQLAVRVVDKKSVQRQAVKGRDYFYKPTEVEQHDLKDHLGKDPKVLDRILAGSCKDVVRNIDTTESLKEIDEHLTAEELKEVAEMRKNKKKVGKLVNDALARKQAELIAQSVANVAAKQGA